MSPRALALLGLVLGGSPALAAAADGFAPADVFALRWVGDPQIRPDGAQVAFVRNTASIMTDRAEPSLWLADASSGAETPLATGPARSPRWSPDGRRLAYVASNEGAPPQLMVRWMGTGVAAKVADLPQSPNHVAWSPDGTKIAFTMLVPAEGASLGAPLRKPEGAKWAEPLKIIDQVAYRADGAGYLKPGYRQVFVVSADGGAPRQLTTGDFDADGEIAWTPDGRSILFSSDREAGWQHRAIRADVWRVAVDGALTRLVSLDGPAGDAVASPDGSRIAFVGYADAHKPYQQPGLWIAEADGSQPRELTKALDRGATNPRWAADGKSLYFLYADHGVTKIGRVTLAGQVTAVASGLAGEEIDRPYAGGDYSVARTGAVAFIQGAPEQPPELAVATGGGSRRLTHSNDGLLERKTLAKVTPLNVKSAFDGQPIDAWMVTPPAFDPARRYPMILEIHGGPYAAYGPTWSTEDQLYAAAGYVVVYANPRGSTSYGQAFADGIAGNYPGHDYDDLMSVTDAAIASGHVDPNDLFVTGGSGGGLLTAWIVGKTDRFRAAVSQKPVIDWASWSLTTDMYLLATNYWFPKPPWADEAAYWSHSPISLVGNVKTPTMVMVGEEDHRTPPSEAEQFYQGLQVAKIPTILIRVPGASHGGYADRPSQLAAENAAILAWFGRYRTDRAAAQPAQ